MALYICLEFVGTEGRTLILVACGIPLVENLRLLLLQVCQIKLHLLISLLLNDFTASVQRSTGDACLNGVYYWIARVLKDDENPFFRFLSFNFTTEVFRFSDPPPGVLPFVYPGFDEFIWKIGLYNECLALYFTRSVYMVEACVDIWVDDDFGNVWFPLDQFLKGLVHHSGHNGWMMHDGELSLCNPATGEFRKL
ncbi:hypothetical protein RDABS01_037196, partial [Bienertia sinuspersici]